MDHASSHLKSNRSFVLQAMKANEDILRYVADEIRNDRHVILEAVKRNGTALHYAGLRLRDDLAVVLTAVRQSRLALGWASWEQQKRIRSMVMMAGVNRYMRCQARDDPKLLTVQGFQRLVVEGLCRYCVDG